MYKKLFLHWDKRPHKNIDIIIIGLCKVIDGTISVLSLGFLLPSLHVDYVMWRTKERIKLLREKEKTDGNV